MNNENKDSPAEEKNLSQKVISGGMLQINGSGVLIRGDSGVGKSESSLELISRGWRFVSDDVTNIKKLSGGKLIGTSPAISRYFMEIRGLGIINIKQIFGSKSVCKRSRIDLIINLKRWEQDK
jgi:HPr kinase/phosphorylase